jgi:hypothetical protein
MGRRWKAAACGAALLTLTGCGYLGEPLPPQANIPARVADLAAVQRGANLIVQFTAPHITTEGVAIKRGLTLDLAIGPGHEPFNPEAWAAGARHAQATADENRHVRCEVPAGGWVGREVVMAVKAIGRNGKDAGWSNYAVVSVVAPPETPRNLAAQAVVEGVRLTWQAVGPAFRIFRRDGGGALAVVGNTERPEWTDATSEAGKPYVYLVQTIVKAGKQEAESMPSAEVQITPDDKFPPAVPVGLEAAESPVSIGLTWTANAEPDLATYRVYRALGDGAFGKVGESAGVPSFSDRNVEHGKRYRYVVSAVDKAGNESARSAAVQAALP